MKILIAGDGKVGQTLAAELSEEGYELTVIDTDTRVLNESVERFDVMGLEGNCASIPTLRRANVENADLLITATGSDETNLLACMTAHAMNPRLHTIARIRNPEYREQAYLMGEAFGLSLVFNPEKQAAEEIEHLLKFPGFLKRDTFAKGRVEIVELRIEKDSPLKDIPLSAMNGTVKCKVLVCTVLRDGEAVTPDGNFVLHEGDRVFVTAPRDTLALLLKNLGIVTHKVKSVLLAGGGMVSYYLADLLLKSHIDVKILEEDPARCEKLSALLPRAVIINGDAGSQPLLESEGIDATDAFVSLTGLDELNIILSLFGKSRGVPQIITKIGRLDDTRVIDSLPVGSIVCPRKLCCNTILRYVRAMRNQAGAAVTIHAIADGQSEALEFVVDESAMHRDEPLKNIRFRKNILLVGISRGYKTVIPDGDSSFTLGDSVVVVATNDATVLQFNDIFA